MLARTGIRFLWLLLTVMMILPVQAEQPFSFESTPGQLPKTVVPRHYVLRLQPDFEKFTTHGTLMIDVEVHKAVKEIVLNAVDIDVTKANLHGRAEMALEPSLDAGKQLLRLKLPKSIRAGMYQIELEFNGKIGEAAQGFFYVKYPTPSGKKTMLATQMEPTDARRMFPCWDEPVFRATFDLTVVLPENKTAISNMPIEHENKIPGGLRQIQFGRTPAMASYLVLLVAGEFSELKDEVDGVKIRVITTEGKQEQGRYALDATKKLLAYYNDYFGIKYPLPKLDQIAVPGGFGGAMENWGAITYNESILLFDPKSSSEQTKREIFVTVAHEMAHQWFGDLVTTAWWDNLWLNEGFASWMETKATDHFNPDWNMWLVASSDKSGVMSGDARRPTHPIQQPVRNESEANDAFDGITYSKGAAFLRMLEDYLGQAEFRQGVHNYLAAHRYSNTTTADLWNALEQVSGKSVHDLAAGWTEQSGVPVLKIETDCTNGRLHVQIKQERLVVETLHPKPTEWQIPVSLLDAAHTNRTSHLLLTHSASLTFPDCTSIVKLNAGDNGYYRVQYPPELFAQLRHSAHTLPIADRLNLLNDSWAMVEAGKDTVTNFFGLAQEFRSEKSSVIWDQMVGALYFFDDLQEQQPGREAFQKYARWFLQPPFARLGWEAIPGESANDALLRTKIISALGHFDDEKVIAEAQKRFTDFLANADSLTPNLRPAVLNIVGRYSDQNTYGRIHDLAERATGTEERQLYYHAMCAALDPELARATLAISLTDETVPEEATSLVTDVATTGEQKVLAWQFASTHIHELLAKVETFSRNNYVPSIFSAFSDSAYADELENYVRKNVSEDAMIKAGETAADIRLKALLKKRELPNIDRWVANSHAN